MSAISVIVPIYKVEKYIHQCVDSILAQTFTDFELILVDDGSPDNCGAICDEYAAKDERIVVIHQENGGLSAARNAGLDVASGEFLVFVDSDDWIRADMLEVLLNEQKQTDADLVLCNIQPTYPVDYTGWKRPVTPLEHAVLNQEQMVQCLVLHHNWFYCVACNKLYKREIFEKLRFPVGFIHEDEAVIHRVVGLCEKIAITPEVLYFYRQTTQSITGMGLRIQNTDKLQAYVDRIVYCEEKKWQALTDATLRGYIYWLLELYFQFSRTEEYEHYFLRMDQGLKVVLPYILKAKSVSLRHKLYMTIIRFNPPIYIKLKRLLKG